MHDVLISGDTSRGQTVLANVIGQPVTNLPPTFNMTTLTIQATVGQLTTVPFQATDPENEAITFSLDGLIKSDTGATINPSTGLFTWTPSNTAVTSLSINVIDSSGFASSLDVNIKLCGCQNGGTCNNNDPAISDTANRFELKSCTCSLGYSGVLCSQDEDSCATNNPCAPMVTCTDLPPPATGPTGVSCGPCPTGFTGDGQFCIKDVCASNPCQQKCNFDTAITHTCSCNTGYILNTTDNMSCIDINECDSNPCVASLQTCVNTPGSYRCDCLSGLVPNNVTGCSDFNECTRGTHNCSTNSTNCFNQLRTFRCNCKTGFTAISSSITSCEDIDECTTGAHTCVGPRFTCKNNFGSYICECGIGFTQSTSNTSDCVDINECLTNPCPARNGVCNNVDGTYNCMCQTGYTYNSAANTCDDINECSANAGKGNCSHNCSNTNGSFVCTCPSGYQISTDSLTCVDVNECNTGTPCQQMCNNTVGSYFCTCFDGFFMSGTTCVANTTCSTTDAARCVNSDCFVNASLPVCMCRAGYEIHNSTYCSDINECSESNSCHGSATCTNVPGSFRCACNAHFVDMSGVGTTGIICQELAPITGANIATSDIKLSTVRVRWGSGSTGDNFTIYLLEEGSTSRVQEQVLAIGTQEYTFNGLMPNTSYSFNIDRRLGNVVSTTATINFVTLPNLAVPVLNAISPSDVTSTSIRVTWSSVRAPIDDYTFSVTPTGGSVSTETIPADITEKLLSSLQPATQYTISILTRFGVNVSSASTLQQYTAPNPPESVSVSTTSTYGELMLVWSAPTLGTTNNYVVTFNPTGPTFTRTTGATSGIITNLTPGTTYSVTISSQFMGISSTTVTVSALVPITTTQAPTTLDATTEAVTTQEVTTQAQPATTAVVPTTQANIATTKADSTTLEAAVPTTDKVTTTPQTTEVALTTTAAPVAPCPVFQSFVNSQCLNSQVFTITLRFTITFTTDLTDTTSTAYTDFEAMYSYLFDLTLTSGSVIATSAATVANVTDTAATQTAIQALVTSNSLPELQNTSLSSFTMTKFSGKM
ncbi:uncharacterized protein LOC144744818 [Ciona intestinalis]